MSWREALPEAPDLAGGFVVINSRNESEEVKDIVENATCLFDMTDLYIVDDPVGIKSRIRDMIQRLNIQQSNDIMPLGLWGMGGIGKTTIAKAINDKQMKVNELSFLVGMHSTIVAGSKIFLKIKYNKNDRNKLGMHDLICYETWEQTFGDFSMSSIHSPFKMKL
ncbi:unnamed protein product [Trifolium pratense]|uniref:Uncharacterized protein n=1 Tax=Trifolium pratense TaxID=57577 RepID=A0ACB0LWB6_TRIPR|nr:unnamed protein product [Trifolium pratense]